MEKIVVYDLDGTLIDVSERLSKSLEEVGIQSLEEASDEQYDEVMKIFNSKKYLDTDKPIENVIKQLRDEADEYGVFILTGRVDDAKKATKRQLKDFDIPYDEVIFVNEDLKDIKATAENKAKQIQELQKQYEIVKFVDDIKENREAVAKIIGVDKVQDPKVIEGTAKEELETEKTEIENKTKRKSPEQEITEYALGMTEE